MSAPEPAELQFDLATFEGAEQYIAANAAKAAAAKAAQPGGGAAAEPAPPAAAQPAVAPAVDPPGTKRGSKRGSPDGEVAVSEVEQLVSRLEKQEPLTKEDLVIVAGLATQARQAYLERDNAVRARIDALLQNRYALPVPPSEDKKEEFIQSLIDNPLFLENLEQRAAAAASAPSNARSQPDDALANMLERFRNIPNVLQQHRKTARVDASAEKQQPPPQEPSLAQSQMDMALMSAMVNRQLEPARTPIWAPPRQAGRPA